MDEDDEDVVEELTDDGPAGGEILRSLLKGLLLMLLLPVSKDPRMLVLLPRVGIALVEPPVAAVTAAMSTLCRFPRRPLKKFMGSGASRSPLLPVPPVLGFALAPPPFPSPLLALTLLFPPLLAMVVVLLAAEVRCLAGGELTSNCQLLSGREIDAMRVCRYCPSRASFIALERFTDDCERICRTDVDFPAVVLAVSPPPDPGCCGILSRLLALLLALGSLVLTSDGIGKSKVGGCAALVLLVLLVLLLLLVLPLVFLLFVWSIGERFMMRCK